MSKYAVRAPLRAQKGQKIVITIPPHLERVWRALGLELALATPRPAPRRAEWSRIRRPRHEGRVNDKDFNLWLQ